MRSRILTMVGRFGWSHRNGRSTTGSTPPLLFIGGVCLFLAAIFCGIGGTLWVTEQRYRQSGVRARAVVTDKVLRHATADTSTVYEITYAFTAADGQLRSQAEGVPVHLWEAAERGAPVEIEYVPGDPASARVPPPTAEGTIVAGVMLGVGVVLGAIGLGTIGAALRARRAARESAALQTAGTDEPGKLPASAPEPRDRDPSAWRQFRSSFGFLFGGIFLLCGLPFLVLGLFFFYDDWRFSRDARAAEGLVLTKDIRYSSSGSGSRRSRTRHYEVTYRFAAGGGSYEGEDELSRGEWLRLREREPVEVFYRPGRPSSSRLTRHGDWVLKSIFLLLGGVFSVIGGVVFGRALAAARLRARLQEHGLRADATIVSLAPRNLRINNVRQWRLRYAYQDFQGVRREGTTDLPEPDARDWAVGQTGRVLYDRTRPASAVWVGREGS